MYTHIYVRIHIYIYSYTQIYAHKKRDLACIQAKTQANVSCQQGLFSFVLRRDDTTHDQQNSLARELPDISAKVTFCVESEKECEVKTHPTRGKQEKKGKKPACRGAC